jgi:4-hydroxybenzoate polyprenyltransferase
VSAPSAPGLDPRGGLGRFLEIQNLGLNLPFALAFLFLAARGLPGLEIVLLVIVAFVAARNAGHSFNRWVDRRLDAANPRTRERALPSGRLSPGFALAFCAGNAAVLVAAAYFLNPLAFVLAPVALAVVLGYSYTKRVTTFTTAFLGLVEAITPAAVFIAVRGDLPIEVLWAVGGLLAYGTAFETIHSVGDYASDRELGLFSIPQRWGIRRSVRLVVALHVLALALLVAFGAALGLTIPYYLGLAAMGILMGITDRGFVARPRETRTPFRRHFGMSACFLVGTLLAVFVPWGPALFH